MDYGTLQMLKFEVHAVKESAIDVRSLARIIILLAKDSLHSSCRREPVRREHQTAPYVT